MITAIVTVVWNVLEPILETIPMFTFNPDINLSPAIALVCNILWLLPCEAILWCIGCFVAIWGIRVTVIFISLVRNYIRGH